MRQSYRRARVRLLRGVKWPLSGGAKLFVPLQAMPFIDGTEVDFVREGLNQIFKFHNPKAQNECGCGESFGV